MELSLGLNFPPLFLKINFEERSYTDLNYSIQHLSSPYYYISYIPGAILFIP